MGGFWDVLFVNLLKVFLMTGGLFAVEFSHLTILLLRHFPILIDLDFDYLWQIDSLSNQCAKPFSNSPTKCLV